jgi:sugar O-acyltransferase (sialic acid O-acetyltransferase NeuD family)
MPLLRTQEPNTTRCVFIDDGLAGDVVNGVPVLAFDEFAALEAEDKKVAIAISDGRTRMKLARRCYEAGLEFLSVHSKWCVIMDEVSIGPGALLSPFTVLTSNIRIGAHFHCNLHSYVEHDCVIGDFVTFAPAVRCNGNVRIGDCAYIGSNAVIRQGLSIGEFATVGMGAVVVNDIPANEVWVGNPARRLR